MLPLWPWAGVIVLMLRHHMHKTVLTGGWRKLPFSFRNCINVFLFQRKYLSLAPVRRYSAHATASHAQDCPDWDLEKTYVLFSVNVSHKNKLICTGWTHLVELLCSSCKLFVPDPLWVLVPVRALSCSCFGIYMHNTVPFGGWSPEATLY